MARHHATPDGDIPFTPAEEAEWDAIEAEYLLQEPERIRARAEAEIRNKYAQQIQEIASPYSPTERESWFTQIKEADLYLADSTSVTPMLSKIAESRGIPLAELVTKIKENDALFSQAIGTLLGQQQADLDALKNTPL